MQGGSAATDGYHSANATVTHNEDQMAEATIGALSNLATATTANELHLS
jgi:CheY-specific phosphatase CheX